MSTAGGAWGLESCFWKLETLAKALEEQAFHSRVFGTLVAEKGSSLDTKSS